MSRRDEEQHIWCLRITELCDIDREFFALEAGERMRKRAQIGATPRRGIDEARSGRLVRGVELARVRSHALTVAGAGGEPDGLPRLAWKILQIVCAHTTLRDMSMHGPLASGCGVSDRLG